MFDCSDCRNELKLCKLCAERAKINSLCANTIISKKSCSLASEFMSLSADSATINHLCVPQDLKASSVEALNLNANNLCSQNGVINKLCVNDLTVSNVKNCVKWRAAVGLAADTVYTLGTEINWDVVVDDPNGNVALAPFSYTVPASGYYSLTFDINHRGLTGAALIAGIPVGLLTIEKNGTLIRNTYAPFLSFSPRQNSALSTLALLNAGDVVKMRYDVLILDAITGLISYSGTVVLEGNGEFDGKSGFAIHFLSSLDCEPGQGGQPCTPCAPVSIPCAPVSISCVNSPCVQTNPIPTPCDSCQ